MGRLIKKNSIRFQFFSMILMTIILVILVILIGNRLFSEFIFKYFKIQNVKSICEGVNQYYNNNRYLDLKSEFEKVEIKNDLAILIIDEQDEIVYNNYKGMKASIERIKENNSNKGIYKTDKYSIQSYDVVGMPSFILVNYALDNGYDMYVRISTLPIQEAVKVVNSCLIAIGFILLIVFAIIAWILSKRISDPITQLIDVTSDMKRLKFDKKYRITNYDGEINILGNNINQISNKFEKTIRQLRNNNNELERGIEEQTKIDMMRQQFISDVSHELKTPISLIEGYAEGLLEDVNEDEESRKNYAEVILDESKKMDKLVGELLELMNYEYKEKKLSDDEIDLVNVIDEEIKRENIILSNKKIIVVFKQNEPILILADRKSTERVVSNYLTNAIKHCKKVNKEKKIVIRTENLENNKVRFFVYNTGRKIPEEYKTKIWSRFFKIDSSRNRKDGGTGIGLAMVKAIMQNYNNKYGFDNYDDGVEFFCDFNLANKNKKGSKNRRQ